MMKNWLSLILILAITTGCSSSAKKAQNEGPQSTGGSASEQANQESATPQTGSDAIAAAVGEEEETAASQSATVTTATPEVYKRFDQARKSKRIQEAVDAAGELLARNPNDIVVLNGLATLYIETGKLEAAKLVLSRALAKAPNESALHNNAGLIELKSKNLRGALIEFKKAVKEDGRNRSAHANLGVVYLQYQNYKAAADELRAAVSDGDQRPEILCDYALALKMTGQIDRALEMYERATGRAPNSVPIMLNFATLLIENANRPKRGLKVINKIRMVATEPDILEKTRELARKAEAQAKNSQEKESLE